MCGNGILGFGLVLFALTSIVLVVRLFSSTPGKDKQPGLMYKAYLLATILIGQAMISAEVLNHGDYAASMFPLVVMIWPPVSLAVSLTVDRRWCAFPVAYSAFQIWSVLYLATRICDATPLNPDNYMIMLGTLMTLGAVLTLVLTKLRRH